MIPLATPRRAGLSTTALAVALFAACCAAPLAAEQAPPWEGRPMEASPAEVLAAAEALTPAGDLPLDYLWWDVAYQVSESREVSLRRRQVFRLVDDAALEAASVISVHWAPWHQRRPTIRARVITPAGEEHWLDPATIDESPAAETAPNVFSDSRILQAPLPALVAGAVVEVEMVVEETTAPFAAGSVYSEIPTVPGSIRRFRMRVESPADLPITAHAALVQPLEPRVESAEGRTVRTWEILDLSIPAVFEPSMPRELPWLPRVSFATAPSWRSVAALYSKVVDERIGDTDLSSLVAEARSGATSESEVMARLLATVQERVRYTGLEFGEQSIVPRSPTETLERRYGDCKDKATLLVALLRQAGIPAYVALLRALHPMAVDPVLPGIGQFNHAIVYVPAAPAIWIDPTDEFARVGELPVGDQGRLALVAAPATETLSLTPTAEPRDNLIEETREIFLADYGPARVVETTVFHGAAERGARRGLGMAERQRQTEWLQGYAEGSYLSSEIGDYEIAEAADLSQPFRMRLEVKNARRAQTDLDQAAVAIHLRGLVERLPDDLAAAATPSRRWDYVLEEPFVTEWRYRIVPPPGFELRELPETITEEIGPALLERRYRLEESGVVHATLRFDTRKARLTPEELRRLVDGLEDVEAAQALWFDQRGAAHLAEGRIAQAVEEFRRLREGADRSALPRLQMARALLAGGLGSEARREVQEAVELEPDLALAHRLQGWVLMHDELGRYLSEGLDREGALAAFQRAAELDPEDIPARGNRAILLEHDARAQRYSPEADLAGAVEAYRALRDETGTAQFDGNLLVNLFFLGRYDEVRSEAGAQELDSDRQAVLTAAIAAQSGTASALRQLAGAMPQRDRRRTVLQAAAQHLLQARRYPEAGEILRRAADGSENAAELLANADLLSRTKRWEEAELPDDAGHAFHRILLMAASGADSERWREVLARRSWRLLPEEQRSGEALSQEVRKALNESSGSLSATVDLALAAISAAAEGDDATGYRLRLRSAYDEGPGDLLLVVREDGFYKLLASQDSWLPLADLILELLEDGDLEAAGRWLDRARQGFPGTAEGDPGAADPLPRLWTEGDARDALRMRLAAGALLISENDDPEAAARRAIEVLAPRVAEAPEGTEEGVRLALVRAHVIAGAEPEAVAHGRWLMAKHPDSAAVLGLTATLMVELGQDEALEELLAARLTARPGDPMALRIQTEAAVSRGELIAAVQVLEGLVQRGAATAEDYNNLAWYLLLVGGRDSEALQLAQRASQLSDHRDPASLHTLATAYALLDRPREAYQILLQAIAPGDAEAETHDYFVLGRIAESLGLPEAARRYYTRVDPPEDERLRATSTFVLAQGRLRRLAAAKAARAMQEPPASPVDGRR